MVFLNLLYNLMAAYPLKFYTVLTDIKKHKKQKSGQDQREGEPEATAIDEMAAAMADQLYKALTNPSDPSIYREYRASSMLTGKRVVLMREGEPEATAIDVTPEGHLVVRFDDGRTEELYSGEVSVRAAEYPHTV